jgi:hypothetical protein
MKNSSIEETIVVPDESNNGFLTGMLASACQSKGLDAGAVMAMCNNRNGSGFDLNEIIALIVIAAIFGNGNGGFFGGGNNNGNAERQMIMDSLQRNGIEISQLANNLNCSVGQIQNAINQVAGQICRIEGQVGMTGQQIINSLQQGNMALTQQICNCCCDIKSVISQQTSTLQSDINFIGRGLERGFADLGYASKDQTCAIKEAIANSTESILSGQRAAEMREMQREITERDRKIAEQSVAINNAQQSAAFAQMIGQALGPVNAGLMALNKEVSEIQCRLPETKVIPCQDNYVRVNTGINVPLQVAPSAYSPCGAFGGQGYGYGYGFNPYGCNGGWG